MKSSVIVARHPLHPMLIPIPITSFLLALIGDIAYLATGSPFWYSFSLWTIGIGIVGALLAAVPGIVDYLTIASRGPGLMRSQATQHLILNLLVVGLFAVDFALRAFFNGAVAPVLGWAVGLTVVGNALLVYSGWLGGELVYRHRIAVEERGSDVSPVFRVTLSPAPAPEAEPLGTEPRRRRIP